MPDTHEGCVNLTSNSENRFILRWIRTHQTASECANFCASMILGVIILFATKSGYPDFYKKQVDRQFEMQCTRQILGISQTNYKWQIINNNENTEKACLHLVNRVFWRLDDSWLVKKSRNCKPNTKKGKESRKKRETKRESQEEVVQQHVVYEQ